MKQDFIILGIVNAGWWGRMPDWLQSLVVLGGLIGGAFALGMTVSEQIQTAQDLPTAVAHNTRRTLRDSMRVDSLAFLHRDDAEINRRLATLESVLWRLDDRTARMTCILTGRPASQCI